MTYIDDRYAQARALYGKRVEIPAHYDMWARGARYGRVVSVGRDGKHVNVRLDHPGVKRLFKVWRLDFDYIKVLE